jgi:hypothetical protein
MKRIGESDNVQLEQMCKKLRIPLVGIYCKDELDELTKEDGCFIINLMNLKTATSGNNVGHWVAYYKDRNIF